jgi:hypothetical protein
MEQGFSDACIALCLEQKPVARVAQTCRAAAIEMPRPTVRKWCETGYNVAYQKTIKDLANHFIGESSTADEVTHEATPVSRKTTSAPAPDSPPTTTDSTQTMTTTDSNEADANDSKNVVATIPITLNEGNTLDLEIMEGQNVEDAVVSFCRANVKSDVSACIRQLLPEVLEKYNAEDKMLRG